MLSVQRSFSIRPFRACKDDVYLLRKLPDEKVATWHLPVLGAALTVLIQDHTDYMGVKTPCGRHITWKLDRQARERGKR